METSAALAKAQDARPCRVENGVAARILLLATVLAGLAIIAHVLYVYRFRYKEMAFGLYYPWWKEFREGLDPWHAKPSCLYPPPFVIWFSPLSAFSQPVAYWIWQSTQVAAFISAIVLIIRETARRLTIARLALVVGLIALALPYFFTSTLYESEPTALLLVLLVAAWRLARHQRPVAAGLMLAMATVLKVYPVAAGGYFLFRRRLRVVFAGAAWTIAIVVMTDPRRWLNSASHGAGPYFKSLAWASDGRAISIPLNTYAALTCFAGNAPTALLLTASSIMGIILLASAALTTWRAADAVEIDGMAFGLWMAVMLLLCPLTWNHEITLILPAYLCAAIDLVQRNPKLPVVALTLLVFALGGHAAAYYSTPIRNLHADFVAVIVGYIAISILINDSTTRERGSENIG
jgi:glycosyl transferase family 87